MVSFFGTMGVLCRVFLDFGWYTMGFTEAGGYPSPYIPTNAIGSFIMGFMVATKDSVFSK